MFMDDIVDAIDSIISVQGLMIEAEKELRTETEFLKNKKKEESEKLREMEMLVDRSEQIQRKFYCYSNQVKTIESCSVSYGI